MRRHLLLRIIRGIREYSITLHKLHFLIIAFLSIQYEAGKILAFCLIKILNYITSGTLEYFNFFL